MWRYRGESRHYGVSAIRINDEAGFRLHGMPKAEIASSQAEGQAPDPRHPESRSGHEEAGAWLNLRSIASAVAIPIRPDSLSREACLVRSIVQQTRVKPNIFLSGSEQEPPTWPQAEIFYDFRAPIIQMEGMQRDEKVGICGEFFPRPDVPTCRIALRRMTQAFIGNCAGSKVLLIPIFS